jgi:outer membrane protein OmpA-like peptidoglycan-associated protein
MKGQPIRAVQQPKGERDKESPMSFGPYQYVDDFSTDLPAADLWDFGVASAMPLRSHLAWLDAVAEIIKAEVNKGDRNSVRIWIDGQASYTGDEVRNRNLSEARESAIENYLKKILVDTGRVYISRQWEGFQVARYKGHARGVENARDRCVRVVVSRAASPPLPVPPRPLPPPVMIDTLIQEVYMQHTLGDKLQNPIDWDPNPTPWVRVRQTFGKSRAGVSKCRITHDLDGQLLNYPATDLRNLTVAFRGTIRTVNYSYDPPATPDLGPKFPFPSNAAEFERIEQGGVRHDPPDDK